MSDSKPTFSRFLDLPPEIRERIYELRYLDDIRLLDIPSYNISEIKEPSLTRVSKLVRKEALPIFYSTYCFAMSILPTSGVTDHALIQVGGSCTATIGPIVAMLSTVLEAILT